MIEKTLSAATVLEAAIRIELARLDNLTNAIGQGQSYALTVNDIGRMRNELEQALVDAYEADRSPAVIYPDAKTTERR